MCLQSSCILSKTIGNNPLQQPQQQCNSTQFGTTNLYNWYDYCLSSGNDNSGEYCATSTECYQYRKSIGPSVTYAWHNLTCNPSTCMLIASNGAPPPTPSMIDPHSNINKSNGNDHSILKATDENNTSNGSGSNSSSSNRHHYYHDKHPFHNPAAIALTIVCSLVLIVAIVWIIRLCKKKGWWPFTPMAAAIARNKKRRRGGQQAMASRDSVASSVPSSAPPSFSSTPPDMAIIRHPHVHLYRHQYGQQDASIHSARSSTGSSVEPLPSYLTPYPLPPKYEQAIVTQIRGFRGDDGGSISTLGSSSNTPTATTSDGYHHNNTAPFPSMWVPVYFTQQQANFRRGVNGGELFGFTPNHSYWLQQYAPNQQFSAHAQQQQQQEEAQPATQPPASPQS